MKMIKPLLLAAALFSASAYAQTAVELHITHKLGSPAPFSFTASGTNDLGVGFTVSRIQYYISDISITHDGGQVADVPKSHYIFADGAVNIIDGLGSYNITTVEAISFHIGVDTPYNHNDPSLWLPGAPLAPKSPSMHWGWASGYNFVCMEGRGGTASNIYEIHALGDENYFKATVATSGVAATGKIIIPVFADYQQAVKGIDVGSGIVAHGGGAIELKLLQNFRDYVFSVGTPLPTAVNDPVNTTQGISVYPNPSAAGITNLVFSNVSSPATVTVADLNGSLIATAHKAAGQSAIQLGIATPGLYSVKATMADGSTSVSKLVIE